MQPLPYLLAVLLSTAGILVGYLLLRIAPEEQRPLRKPVRIAHQSSIFFALSVAALFVILGRSALAIALFCVAVGFPLIVFWLGRKMFITRKTEIYSASLGLGTALLSTHAQLFLFLLSAAFVFFATQPILALRKSRESPLPLLWANIGYPIAALLGYAILALP